MITDIKQELIEKITSIDDENLLLLIKEDIEYFSNKGKTKVLDELSQEDLQDLENLLNEPFGHETESYEEYKKASERWNIK